MASLWLYFAPRRPRDVSRAGSAALRSATLFMLAAAGAVVLALWFCVQMIVVSRVEALKKHFTTAGESGRLSGMQNENSSDEIGRLAKSFNEMADQVNNLRDALADSSYRAGMAEWAAGTLHNVRNALSPINLGALKIQNICNVSSLKNMKTALDELNSNLADPEQHRRTCGIRRFTRPGVDGLRGERGFSFQGDRDRQQGDRRYCGGIREVQPARDDDRAYRAAADDRSTRPDRDRAQGRTGSA